MKHKLLNDINRGIIVLGDFNAVTNKVLDRSRFTATPEIPKVLQEVMRDLDLIDIW